MIKYSLRSRRAYARLMRPYNDVDIYVEDSKLLGVYERLANAALRGRGKVTKVTALGPRENVLAAAFADTSPAGRPRLYIVDGDLDLVAYARRPTAPHLYRLAVYCVENLVFEDAAVVRYAAFACPNLTEETARAATDVPTLYDAACTLLPLFSILGIARRLRLRGPAYRIDPAPLLRVQQGHQVAVNPQAVRRRVRSVIRAIVDARGWRAYRRERSAIRKIMSARRPAPIEAVSGKAFLIPLLNGRVGIAGGHCQRSSAIVSYLADHCTFARDRGLERKLRSLLPAA